jgi:hypothetical protein
VIRTGITPNGARSKKKIFLSLIKKKAPKKMNTAMQVSFDLSSRHPGNPGSTELAQFAGIYRWHQPTGSYLFKKFDGNRRMQYVGVVCREAYGSRSSWTLGLFKGPIATTANQKVFVARKMWSPVINMSDTWLAQSGPVAINTILPFVRVQGPVGV